MKLTKAQTWALRAVASGYGGSPATLGQQMMERPGAMGDRTTHYKAQGYGRMGGAMMKRLKEMGLAQTTIQTMGQWHPTRAVITPAGRSALTAAEGREDE
jgi:hypothetical protein